MFSEAQEISTYLSMVRTDYYQIQSILESTYFELGQVQLDKPGEKTFIDHYKPYVELLKIFLFGQLNYNQASEELKKSANIRGVCAKTLKAGDVAWKCETCELDPTCIICQECFEKSNHKGHKVWLKRNVSGCCDCGDPDAWREDGFCSDHKGYAASSEILLEKLPMFVKNSARMVFRVVAKQIKQQCLNLQSQDYLKEKSNKIDKDYINSVLKSQILIKIYFEFLTWSIEASPAFIHFITDQFYDIFPDTIISEKNAHKCCPRTFINQNDHQLFMNQVSKLIEDKAIQEEENENQDFIEQTENFSTKANAQEKKLQALIDGNQFCTCSPLDLTCQTNHLITKEIQKIVYEFYFKMFQSFKFKQILGLSFAANFEVLTTKQKQSGNNLGSIGVQILTIDDISLKIMSEEKLRQSFLSTFSKVIDLMVKDSYSEVSINQCFHILYDFKYMARPKVLNYVIYQTDFLECLLEQLVKLYYTDEIEFRDQHISFDLSIYKQGLYQIDIHLTKIFKQYFNEIDPTNVPRNKKLMSAFIVFFDEINSKMKNDSNFGFFALPLHRAFSYYLTRLVMHNYFIEKDLFPNKRPKDLFKDIIRKYIEVPAHLNAWTYIHNVISMIIRPLTRCWAFSHEILSGKWVMSGLYIMQLPKILYSVFQQYLLLQLSLFQILLAIAPEPQKIINEMLLIYQMDPWMKILHDQLIRKQLKLDAYDKYKPLFDIKKLRQMMHWELRLFIQLSIVEVPFIYPLNTDLNRQDKLHFQTASVVSKIDNLFVRNMQREIVHSLIMLNGRADIKTLKEKLEDLYSESEKFEDTLLTVADQIKEQQQKGTRITFKLKDEFLKWFDPYFYLIPESQASVIEAVKSMPADKKVFNDIIGDSLNNYKFNTDINFLIKEALSQSPLINYIKELIINYATDSQDQFKIVDEQIGHEALKLLSIVIQALDKEGQSIRDYTISLIRDQNFEFAEALFKLQKQGGTMEKSCTEILTQIYNLDNVNLVSIGKRLGLVMEEDSLQQIQTTTVETQESSSSLKEKQKLNAKLRKEQIMKKFANKRQDYMAKNVSDQTSLNLSKSSSYKQDASFLDEEEEIECSLCKETLVKENFYSEPYGQFAYVSRSKLMYYTLKQTLKMQTDNIQSLQLQGQVQEEEEKKASEIEKENQNNDPQKVLNINYLDNNENTGGTIIKCTHYSHYKCLNEYLSTNEADRRKSELRKIVGLDLGTFQCPLCKHISNLLFPCDTLTNYEQNKLIQKDFDQYRLLEFFTNMLSKILQNQGLKQSQTLPVDVRKNPREVLERVQQFIEHRIQMTDIKGLEEFLRKSKHRVGLSEYARLLDITTNTVRLVVNGEIKTNFLISANEEMTEESFVDVCNYELNKIIADISQKQASSYFDLDFSSVLIQMLFYVSMIYSNNPSQQDQAVLETIKGIYKVFKLQVLIKIAFLSSNGFLKGISKELYEKLQIQELIKLSENQEYQDQIIRAELPFLRKVISMVLIIHFNHRESDLNRVLQEEQFVHDLLRIRDDVEEFKKITEFLQLDTGFSELLQEEIEPEQSSLLPYQDDDQYKYVLQKLSSNFKLKEYLQSYIISKLNTQQLENPSLIQILESQQIIKVEMPASLKLLDTYFTFKLVELPTDFQTLVQNYYKQKCKNCGTQPKDMAICLLCGEICCFLQKCCYNLKDQKHGEGELSFHTRKCEGQVSMFLNTSDGRLIMIENDRSTHRNSPYLNKYGETFSSQSKRWDNFYMDEISGGIHIYEEYRKMYMQFNVANEIIKDRSISDTVWRLRII